MALKMTKTDMRKAARRAESLRSRLANMRKKTEKVTERVVHTAEVSAAAFTMGVIQGKTGGIEIVGVPLELGLGSALNLLGYFGIAGKASAHLHGFGDGCLASYLTTLGRGVGIRMNEGNNEAASSGRFGPSGGGQLGASSLTDAELAAAMASRGLV